jgi:hypothetical protein
MNINRVVVWFICVGIIVSLALKTVTTFTLCGGTLMQNWVGVGACTDQQNKFIGYGDFMMRDREFIGIAVLVLILVIATLTRFVYVSYFKK